MCDEINDNDGTVCEEVIRNGNVIPILWYDIFEITKID